MAIRRNLGGDRLGSGDKMEVEMHGWGKSTHDLSEELKTTMATGTLIPFLNKTVLPADEWKIKLSADVMTIPTNGPLFGSFKFQVDVFFAPYRLYIGQLHNNKLGIGLNMANVKLPLVRMKGRPLDLTKNLDNQHVNPSCIMSYLGVRGIGRNLSTEVRNDFNAIPWLAYWDAYKNYYANKQEGIGAVIHRAPKSDFKYVTKIEIEDDKANKIEVPFNNLNDVTFAEQLNGTKAQYTIISFSNSAQTTDNIVLQLIRIREDNTQARERRLVKSFYNTETKSTTITLENFIDNGEFLILTGWDYAKEYEFDTEPNVVTFNLTNLDDAREYILLRNQQPSFLISANNFGVSGTSNFAPYNLLLEETGTNATLQTSLVNNQEGLALKTYQADIFNAWMKTDFINQIATASAVAVQSNQFTIDQLVLAKKQWEHLNRLVASGGTYRDYIEVAYGVRDLYDFEIPMYLGGLSKEIVFQEITSTADAGDRPLGSLAGKGTFSSKHKGGYVELDAKEAGVILGIMSITPRIDYSQGNQWDMVNIKTMDDLHKPAFDGIGYQDLITDQMAWFDTTNTSLGVRTPKSAGKVVAWLNYMTSFNRALGNFANEEQMWLTLNRRYEYNSSTGEIKDLTTYVDPKKFNYIWADARRDAQNFWVQINSDMRVRRAMSAKQIPAF